MQFDEFVLSFAKLKPDLSKLTLLQYFLLYLESNPVKAWTKKILNLE
jgi:hypothetical protein